MREVFFLFMEQQPLVGQGLLIVEVSRLHSDTSQSAGFLWTRDQPFSEVSTWQHITLTRYIHAPGGIRTRNLNKREVANPRFWLRGYWDRHEGGIHTDYSQELDNQIWTAEYGRAPKLLAGFGLCGKNILYLRSIKTVNSGLCISWSPKFISAMHSEMS